MIDASSSLRALSRAKKLFMMRERRRGGVSAHAANALFALATAVATVSAEASSTLRDAWPVAGLKTSWVRACATATGLP